jgi:hypothetical protein|tara:strand:- start:399 stop:548 length:150 start_codon:yes stop_codon:yes gene_type:complete
MIKLIFEMLETANGETENIRIAQGKYNFPKSIKEAFKQIKKETKWKLQK